MAPFICCGFKRHPSPDSGPICLVENSKIRSRFPVSTTETSDSSAEAAASMHNVFEAAASDEAQGGSFQAKDLAEHEMNQRFQRTESMRNVDRVMNRIETTVSRDSGISKRSSKLSLRSSMRHENLERHRGLKRFLHRRVASFLQDSKIGSEGEYDEDAVLMRTPRSTWGREQDSTVKDIPRRLSRTLDRCPSPIIASHLPTNRPDVSSRSFALGSATGTLSRMLTAKGNQMDSSSNRDKAQIETKVETEVSEARRSRNTQKYTFRDGSKSPQKLPTRTSSPLGRSDTVIRVPSSSAVVELGQPTFLDIVDPRSTPDSRTIEPQCMASMASIGDSVVGCEWRPSYAPSHKPLDCFQFPEAIAKEAIYDVTEDIRGSSIRATPEAWTHGASGLFREPSYPEKAKGNGNHLVYCISQQASQCNLANEEGGFSGVGNADEGIPRGELPNGQDISARKQSSGTDSVHLYNMRIPLRLASQGLLKSVSQPFLQEFATIGDHVASDEYNLVSSKTRRVSSSGVYSGETPNTCGLAEKHATSSTYSQDVPKSFGASFFYSHDVPKKYAASSVYSYESPYITPAESHQSSITFLNRIADRMKRFGPDAPARDVISVPAASNEHVDLDKIEHRTRETSFHSSNESLYHRELAAAVTRIVPRAKTVNLLKNSWFKEDFDDVAAAIAISNPRRRSVSERLNRKPSLSNYDGHKERHLSIRPRADRFRFIAGGNEDACASVWEKALREHEQEDAAISRTRLGSDPVRSDHNNLMMAHRHFRDSSRSPHHRHIVDRFSANHKQEAILQKLDAYQLPSSPRKRTPTDELKPISTPSSPSSWTRYSSHDREQRSPASAGEADNVFARDFSEEATSAARIANQIVDEIDPTASLPTARPSLKAEDGKGKQRPKSMTFGHNALTKLRKIYRIGSLEFVSRTAFGSRGHRSSISEGRSTEYPELEMLPPPSPVVFPALRMLTPVKPPQAVFSKKRSQSKEIAPMPLLEPVSILNDAESADLARVRFAKSGERVGSPSGAKKWSKMYVEDCVTYPTNSPPQALMLYEVPVEESPTSTIEHLGVEEFRLMDMPRGKSEERQLEGSSESEHASPSDQMRKSTLDFKKSLESDERRAREKVLALVTVGNDAAGTPKVSKWENPHQTLIV